MPLSKKRVGAKPRKPVRTMKKEVPKIPGNNLKEVDIKYHISEDLPVIYSDNILVQHRDGMFLIYYMRNQHPIVFKQEDYRNVSHINSTSAVHLAITPLQFARNLVAMQDNFRKYLTASGSKAKTPIEFLREIGDVILPTGNNTDE